MPNEDDTDYFDRENTLQRIIEHHCDLGNPNVFDLARKLAEYSDADLKEELALLVADALLK